MYYYLYTNYVDIRICTRFALIVHKRLRLSSRSPVSLSSSLEVKFEQIYFNIIEASTLLSCATLSTSFLCLC